MRVDAANDVAIIGMAATFAGAPDAATFWSNILGKVDAVTDAPPGWIGDEALYDPASAGDGKHVYTRRGGFLGELARFDPRPFGTMPVALDGAEPDQFLALKSALAALADAGYATNEFDRERTGIILGHTIHANRANVNGFQHVTVLPQTVGLLRSIFPELDDDRCRAIEALLRSKLPNFTVDTVPGLVPNMMTGRIANRLDLMGPNYIVDGACASSLMAIESAAAELRAGRADMMLAGGVNTTTSLLVYIVFCQLGALTRRPGIRPFDKSADGTILGEGQGVVVLKRLEDALRNNDRIYAVIKGTGTSSDGRAMGLMAPRVEGEILAMRRAYANAGLDPDTIGLVEAHGTGIPLGDQMEVQALRALFGERCGPVPHIAMGSVKSMIGHCIPAAGMASVVKMAMALDQKVLPPTLADEINPELGFERTPLFLNTEVLPWIHRNGAPRRAAINAFGFGGINSHMILEEAPGSGAPAAAFGLRHRGPAELFLLAGDTRAAMIAAAEELAAQAGRAEGPALRRLAAETARSLGDGDHRLAILAADPASLRRKLEGAIAKLCDPALHRLQSRDGVFFADQPIGGKLAFVFPGENSQYPHMLRELAVASPVVREWLDRLEGVFPGEREVPHRLLLFPPALGLSERERRGLENRLRQVDNGSEAMFFADMALFSLLQAVGLRPDFVVGHSTGENAAIVAAGLIAASADELRDYVRRMNAIFRDVEAKQVVPRGMLLTIGAIERAAIERVRERYPEIHLTMDNCPNQVILFGPAAQITEIAAELPAQGAVCSALPLSWAYHTPFVAPMAEAFSRLFRDEHIGKPTARIYSCASAAPFPDSVAEIRERLRDQYVSPVRFSDTVRRLYEDGARIFVEVGPGSTLTGFVGDILRDQPHLALASSGKRGSSLEQFLALLGQLFVHRVPLDLAPLYPEAPDIQPQRAAERVLESAIPFIRLVPEEAARLRAMLGGEMPGAAAAPAPAAPRPVRPSLAEHFGLMQEFLRSQEVVTRHALQHRPVEAISAWTGRMELPFPAAVEFISAAGSPASAFASTIVPMLGRGDLDYFERVIASQAPRRQQEWLLGRAAARRALTSWLAAVGDGAAAQQHLIDYDAEGKPILVSPAAGEAASVFLSISHKERVAVAAAANQSVGIDLERFAALRDPGGVLDLAFLPGEAALLGNGADPRLVSIAWSVKEATAKSIGQKLLGRERSFVLTNFDPQRGRARVAHPGGVSEAFYMIDGDFVCTLAAAVSE